MKRTIAIIISVVLTIGISFSALSGCSSKPQQPESAGETEQPGEESGYPTELFDAGIYNPTKVGYSAEYLGTTDRRLPEVLDGGLERYPQ